MSLKEETKEIFQHYGLTEAEIEAYLVFLSYPQFTISEVAGVLEKEEQLTEIQEIAAKLEKIGFIKKIPGVVDRYVPCEPYLELFTKESAQFRSIINKVKDDALADQSSRFENLESIENNAKESINSTVETQIGDIFRETDTKDVHKKELFETTTNRFKTTSEALIQKIRGETFAARDNFEADRTTYTDNVKLKTESARDRFMKTAEELQNSLQTALFHIRDRYETTSKDLENHLHSHLDQRKTQLHDTVNARVQDTEGLWDAQAAKFKNENNNLNSTLTGFSDDYSAKTKAYESEIHGTIDSLNQNLKNIGNQFKQTYQSGVQSQKQQMNKIMDDLLQDFSTRVSNLETECKKSLDDYVAYHKENADNLKPNLDEVLEKNILRMKEVIDKLKVDFSHLLENHMSSVKKINEQYRDTVKERVETRHSQLAGQVLEFKKNTVELMDNLKDTSDRYTELAKTLAKRGSAWKALLFGSHKKMQDNYSEIKERVANISGEMKKNFEESTAIYIQETGKTTTDLNTEISKITTEKNNSFKQETDGLNKKQQESLDATLDGIAKELSTESDAIIKKNVKGIEETNVKIKDSIETSFKTHHDDFDLYLNKHRQTVLDFDDERNSNTAQTVDSWYKDMDQAHEQKKSELSSQIRAHLQQVQDHLTKTTTKNDQHSGIFERAVMDTKIKQKQIFDDLLQTADKDFADCKEKASSDLNEQFNLIKQEIEAKNQAQLDALKQEMDLFRQEVAEINEKQQAEVDAHIQKFKDTIHHLDTNQSTELQKQIQLFSQETATLETELHSMFEKHKSDYDQNTQNLQTSLTKTIETNIQDTKDAIADFTLSFMNSIDEMSEQAEENEVYLENIDQAAKNVRPLGSSSTWHVFGMNALLEAIVASLSRTKSTITIISPTVEPKILEALSKVAFSKKSSRFLYTTNWDMGTYGQIVEKMKQLGNIQFRNLKSANDFYAVSRDGEEIILCPKAPNKEDLISIISMQEGYAQIFGSFIYPMFQANSRPI